MPGYNAVTGTAWLENGGVYVLAKLIAGASWMAEYVNPDIQEEWEYISKYSPYQNLKPDMKYPEVFFTTSTRDDRVHAGHERKAVAKMEELGYKVSSIKMKLIFFTLDVFVLYLPKTYLQIESLNL